MTYRIDEITIRIIDVVAQARELFGEEGAAQIAGRPLPEHDYRFEIIASNGTRKSEVTVHAGASLSAEDILALVRRER